METGSMPVPNLAPCIAYTPISYNTPPPISLFASSGWCGYHGSLLRNLASELFPAIADSLFAGTPAYWVRGEGDNRLLAIAYFFCRHQSFPGIPALSLPSVFRTIHVYRHWLPLKHIHGAWMEEVPHTQCQYRRYWQFDQSFDNCRYSYPGCYTFSSMIQPWTGYP